MHNLAAFERMGWAYPDIECPDGVACLLCKALGFGRY